LEDLRLLVRSRFPLVYVETYDEERIEDRLIAIAVELDLPFWSWSVTDGLCRRGTDPAVAGTTDPALALHHIASLIAPGVYLLRDFHPFLEDPKIVRRLRELAQGFAGTWTTVVLCSPRLEIPVELRKLSARYDLDLPDDAEIRRTLLETFRQLNERRRFRFALDEPELRRFVAALAGLTRAEIRRLVVRAAYDGFALAASDIPALVERRRELLLTQGVLEPVPLDGNRPGLGGLRNLKAWLTRSRAGFSARARELGLPPPRGVLLVGVQGCGKSLAAKTVAAEWEMPLVRLDPGRLFDKYVGESEKNLREALAGADALAPVVMWIDEIEKVFAGTRGEADAGLGRRLFGSFLTWLQEHSRPVFVAATANEIDALPPELLRKGRFDEIFFVDLPRLDERREILELHLGARRQDPAAFDLDHLARASDGLSGAELEQAIVAAAYGVVADGESSLSTERVLAEIARTRPLSATHREAVDSLRGQARRRFVFAN